MRGARWREVVVALLLLGAGPWNAGLRPVRGEEEPTSLVDWLKERHQNASFGARELLFAQEVGGEGYRGTLEQNMRLLRALRGLAARPRADTPSAAPGSTVPAPGPGVQPPGPGQALQTFESDGVRVAFDLDPLVLALEVPEDVRYVEGYSWVMNRAPSAPQAAVEEPAILPTLPADLGPFICAAVLAQKAKQFDDGLYAAVELALQAGPGGKAELLARLRERLRAAQARDAGAGVLEAAARLGAVPGPALRALEPGVGRRLAAFEQTPRLSKPIGFYTWSEDLRRVFRQDRMLQEELPREAAASVAAALREDAAARTAYDRTLRLYEGLTNPYVRADLQSLLAPPGAGPAPASVSLLPPSRSHEGELAKRRWGQTGLPPGRVVMQALIEEVQSGALSLVPQADSGWYDRQSWALEPLLRPERTAEASRLELGPRYRGYLVDLFKGLLALTRETHVKQVECCDILGSWSPSTRPLHVPLELTLEPLPTHYARRAEAYAFVRGVLLEAFGAEGLARLHRLTLDGAVLLDLASELRMLELLFRGAAEVARRELGFAPSQDEADRAAVGAFRTWALTYRMDPDIATDARMMVPVAHDLLTNRTKVWVFLGWTRQRLDVTVRRSPALRSKTTLKPAPWWNGEVHFTIPQGELLSPVMAEADVERVLDRDEFRRHCDRHRTRSAILAALR